MAAVALAAAARASAAQLPLGHADTAAASPPVAAPAPAPALPNADTAAAPPPSVDARPHLFLPREVRTFGLVALGAAAVAPFDGRITRWSQRPGLHQGGVFPRTMDAFRLAAVPGTVVLTGGAYVVGRLTHRPGLADVGLHAGEAVVVSGLTTELLKFAVGRARPTTTGDRNAGVFRPGRGLTESYASFPSGHVTAAFAAAAAAAAEVTRPEIARAHPTLARLVPPLAYTAAALVGVSRVYQDQHWASDAVVGAAVGTVVGRALVRFQHGRAPDRLERWLLPVTLAPVPGGAVVAYRVRFR